MIRDITIGQYYPADSVIHRLDPRIKLFGTIVFIVSVFFIKDIVGLLLATVALGGVIRLSKVPLKYMLQHTLLYLLSITKFSFIFTYLYKYIIP